MYDSHIHTKFSFDSKMEPNEAINEAKSLDMKLTFTEHYDNNANYYGKPISFDYKKYFEVLKNIRKKESVYLGIEMGLDLRENFISDNINLIERLDFDLVLGSVHSLNGILIEHSRGNEELELYYTNYFKYLNEIVNLNPYIDVFAHIDFPIRFGIFSEGMVLEKFIREIDDFMASLVRNNIILEINTKLLHEPLYEKFMKVMLDRYANKNGKYVTLGSDAHSLEEIGRNFNIAKRLISESSVDVVYFRNRKAIIT